MPPPMRNYKNYRRARVLIENDFLRLSFDWLCTRLVSEKSVSAGFKSLCEG